MDIVFKSRAGAEDIERMRKIAQRIGLYDRPSARASHEKIAQDVSEKA